LRASRNVVGVFYLSKGLDIQEFKMKQVAILFAVVLAIGMMASESQAQHYHGGGHGGHHGGYHGGYHGGGHGGGYYRGNNYNRGGFGIAIGNFGYSSYGRHGGVSYRGYAPAYRGGYYGGGYGGCGGGYGRGIVIGW
jgi:hypothetical protein